uniref:NACHT and WD repeat domain containing 1 n=1 Tax=Myripristis murdjan TaxID=586833 RepID=A0A667Y128_9TELE
AVRGKPCWTKLIDGCGCCLLQVVDLRWGIRNITSGDHEASQLFVDEIEACRRISVGPAFTALLGNRYGHRALPRLVPEKQFELLLSKLQKNPKGLKLLNQWFLKDNNADPPMYVLQPITAHFPHYKTQLLQLLRTAATKAEADGDITAEQKQLFYRSVTEIEIDQGLRKEDGEPSALLFVRELPRQRVRDGPKRLAKFMDITADGLLDAEAQELLTGLKSRLYATSQKILNLHCVELSKGSIDPKRKEHAQYLESLCEQFVSQMKARIKREDASCWVLEEVCLHAALSAERCAGMRGREGLLGKLCLAMWESTNAQHSPLVVHGASGMGKTALLCKLAQELRNVLDPRAVVVIRLLSACHPLSPDVDHVLRSVCFQICLACGLTPPPPLIANTHVELVKFFQNLLVKVSQQGSTLLIILDSLDQLSDEHHARRLHWLPADVPPNVHMVVSTDTGSQEFASLRLKLESSGSFFEVESLSADEGKQILDSSLRASQRTLTPEQSNAVLRSFQQTGSPLHLKLILAAAKRWTSFTPLTELCLGTDPQEMMSLLFLSLEEKHGKKLVGAALGYIALAREGLLEAELRDVLSLDDDVIGEVYRYSLPPNPSLIRLPPLLWARLRWDLGENLTESWVDGVAMLRLQNRQLSVAVSARYLAVEQRARRLAVLAEYFLGRWSNRLKPVALPALSLLLSDRKVPPQPLWFAPGLANVRKLQELPYHLLHAGQWEELRQEVIGSAEWLFCKSRVCGVASVIRDLDQCSQYMDCTETRLVRDVLLLIKPNMCLFYTELLGRLLSLAPPFPAVIGRLCSQCEEWLLTCPEPVLVPKCSFLQPPGGALQHTLSAPQGGQSHAAELLVAGLDDGVVITWSLADLQLTHTLLGHTGGSVCLSVCVCVCLYSDNKCCCCYEMLQKIKKNKNGSVSRGKIKLLCAGSPSDRLAVPAEVCCLELAQHKRLLLCGLKTGTVLIYPLAMPQETLCIPPPESLPKVLCLAVGPQERRLAVAYEDAVCLFEITSRDSFPAVEGPLQKFTPSLLHAQVSSMALMADRRLVYGTGCGNVELHDFRSSSSSSLEPHCSKVTCVTAGNWGNHVLVGSEDAVQRLWALNPLALDHTMEYKGFVFEGVLSAAFSESDQFVFTGSQDRTVKVWDVASGNLLYVQYVYAPVMKMVTYRNGFVALSQQGFVIKEVFRCPEHVSLDYNPLRNVRAQYRVTSREKDQPGTETSMSNLQDYNPAQFNLGFMLKTKPSTSCHIL